VNCYCRPTRALLLTIIVLLATVSVALAQSPFGASGSRAGRTLDSSMPNEAVDPFSGTLTIVETDLLLPGNAGLDLRVQRVYSSAIYPGYQNNDLTIEEDSWAGIGWKLHFGRVINPDATVGGQTQIEMGDGSRQALYTTPISPGWITKSFWLYDKSTHVLKLPNGIVYTFGQTAYLGPQLGTVRYVTEIRDPYNNRIEFSYFSAPGPVDGVSQIRQYLGGSQVREVNFTFDATLKAISSMTYNGRTWTYSHVAAGPAGYSRLSGVTPPAGPSTNYAYSNTAPSHELTVLHAPGGGTITYVYGDVTQIAGAVTTVNRGVMTKTLGGRAILPATWTYSYGTGPNHDTTRVVCPCGTTTYRFNGIGNTGTFSGWLAGTLAEQTVEEQAVVLHRSVMTWIPSEQISADPTSGVGGIWADPNVRKALLATTVVTRGQTSWTTTQEFHTNLGNFNDYGRPWRIADDGELHRVIERWFQYGFAPYIVDRVEHESVTIAGQTVPRFWQYDLATGFLTRESLGAVLWTYPYTLYERSPEGNVSAVVDGRGNRTTVLYSWGQVSDVQTPGTHTVYDISPNGWGLGVSNTIDAPTTTAYDLAGRPTSINAAGVNPVGYEYEIGSQWVKTTRGSSWTKTYFDGFGRATNSINSLGLQTRIGLDECGRQNFASYPFTTGYGSRGVTTTYDALGRVKTVLDNDANAITQYSYSGADVTITDPNNRQTLYTYGGFSGPDDVRLLRVRDAANQYTAYTYDAFGNLTSVAGPSSTNPPTAPSRTWTYDVLKGVLTSETQPENGTTTYEYDNAGNRTKVTTSDGITLFTYDGDNRLVLQDVQGTTADDVAFEYDAAGRLKRMAIPSLTSATTSTTYTYDTLGRLSTRQDFVTPQTYQSTYQYDANDQLSTLTYPSGRAVGYQYDSEGRPSAVLNNTAVFANGFTYNDSGKLSAYTTGAVTHTVTYDSRERVQRLTSGSALDLTYSYDLASQVTGIADPRPYMSATFGYDALGRLNTASGIWGTSTWTYDPTGNRLSESRVWAQTTYQYNAATQRLSSITGASAETFGYDARGRLASDSQGTYTYNARELLAQVTKPNLLATYVYDPAGLRVTSTVNGDTSVAIRGAGGEVLSEYRTGCPAAGWTRDAIYVGGRLIGSVRAASTLPSVTLTAASATAAESQTSHAVSVRLTTPTGAATTCPVTVVYATAPGSAIAGSDFTATNGVLTFGAGTASGTVQTIYVTLLPDTTDEYDDEVFHVRLTTATGATIVSPSSQAVTITDDDAPPSISINDVSVTEGASGSTPAVFTVSLSAASGKVVQVAYVNWNGTALAGPDYQFTSGTLTIEPGAISAQITVPVFGDGIFEPNEVFYVHLSAPVNATIADDTGVGTILNDDTARITWGDFNMPLDGAADGALFRPSTGMWTFRDGNTNSVFTFGPWGGSGYIPVPHDYDGDGKTDCALYQSGSGNWFVYSACGNVASTWYQPWGVAGDQPAPADYDGDGKADYAIYRPSDGYWWVLKSSTGAPWATQWGQYWTTSIPVPRDYDGDGKADPTFYTAFNGVWWIQHSTTGATELIGFGIAGDSSVVPTPADYDGDGKADLAFFAPSTGTWYITPSSTGQAYTVAYGNSAMTPVPADYDADGKADIAVWDPTNRVFWILRSTSGQQVPISMSDVGAAGDIPILRRPQ
jgi:YD repeat-containing protein